MVPNSRLRGGVRKGKEEKREREGNLLLFDWAEAFKLKGARLWMMGV